MFPAHLIVCNKVFSELHSISRLYSFILSILPDSQVGTTPVVYSGAGVETGTFGVSGMRVILYSLYTVL